MIQYKPRNQDLPRIYISNRTATSVNKIIRKAAIFFPTCSYWSPGTGRFPHGCGWDVCWCIRFALVTSRAPLLLVETKKLKGVNFVKRKKNWKKVVSCPPPLIISYNVWFPIIICRIVWLAESVPELLSFWLLFMLYPSDWLTWVLNWLNCQGPTLWPQTALALTWCHWGNRALAHPHGSSSKRSATNYSLQLIVCMYIIRTIWASWKLRWALLHLAYREDHSDRSYKVSGGSGIRAKLGDDQL